MFKSIKWKLIVIYFLLVFIAMVILGIFITKEIESYYLQKVESDLSYISNNTIKKLLPEEDLSIHYLDIQKDINRIPLSIGYQILIIDVEDEFKIVSSTNPEYINQNALESLDEIVVMEAANKEPYKKDIPVEGNRQYKIKHMSFPYMNKRNEVIGVIYAMANLDDIYLAIEKSKMIFLRGTMIALFVTIVIGSFIATSIANPINEVTRKAQKMADGDFNQIVDVKSDDEIGQLGSMFNDLTGRLRDTLLLMSSEKSKLDAIINNMADGLIALDKNGNIIHVNPSFVRLMNIDPQVFESSSYDHFIMGYSKDLTFKRIKREKKHSGNEIIELENKNFIKASYVSLKDEKDKIVGLIMVVQDITEHNRLEVMRREFVANVSHELKTPITTIKSYTETLLAGAMEEEEIAKSFLEVINNESDRMARLVKDLLQLSHLDHKKVAWNFKNLNINDFVHDIIKKLEISIREKEHEINFSTSDKNIFVKADRDKLEQVVQNIITNAVKYTPRGGKISVKISKEHGMAVIRVRDTGVGIPKEDLPRVFERFYRVDKARSREMGGTGLGLSIARHIINEHDGEIYVSSQVSKGSEFKITLPVENINV